MIPEARAVDRIATALKEQALLPFVGAGVSCWPEARQYVPNLQSAIHRIPNAHGDLDQAIGSVCVVSKERGWLDTGFTLRKGMCGWPPTWFVHLCMLALLGPTEREGYCHLRFSALAQFLRDGDSSRRLLARLLYTLFHPGGRRFGTPNELHGLIARLPCNHVVTTNFDNGLELASDRTAVPLSAVRDDAALIAKKVSGRRVFKLHGDFFDLQDIPEQGVAAEAQRLLNAVVFQEDTFWRYPGPPNQTGSRSLLCNYISATLPWSQVVFLGYGFDDPNIHEIFRRVPEWPADRRPLLVLEFKPDAATLAFWSSRHVDVVQVKTLKSFLTEINDTIFKPFHSRPGGGHNGEMDSLSLALSVQWLFDLIPPERAEIIRMLAYDRHVFSVDEAKELGLNVRNDKDFSRLLDIPGGLRMVYPESLGDPPFYALDAELRCFLKKLADGKTP